MTWTYPWAKGSGGEGSGGREGEGRGRGGEGEGRGRGGGGEVLNPINQNRFLFLIETLSVSVPHSNKCYRMHGGWTRESTPSVPIVTSATGCMGESTPPVLSVVASEQKLHSRKQERTSSRRAIWVFSKPRKHGVWN